MLQVYTRETLDTFIHRRKGEKKFGEKTTTLSSEKEITTQLQKSNAKFVLLGIPEDIGVRANRGKPGATTAWKATLNALLNTQNNRLNKGKKVLVLGHFDFSEQLKKAATLDSDSLEDQKQLYKLVSEIDTEVSHVIYQIVKAGKKPIVIGGGHNNAYGILKGTALGLSSGVNAVNLDAHTDFRALEGRHSGNGFSYAFEHSFLKKYFMFGLHENYTPKKIFKLIEKYSECLQYTTFEAIKVRKEKGFAYQMNTALNFIKDKPFGVEVDCDSIENVPSSAMTPSGFSTDQARNFVSFFGSDTRAAYLHICEAAPNPEDDQEMYGIGKLISYLITDFIRK